MKLLFVVSPLEHQEKGSKDNSSGIGEKRKLGENASCIMYSLEMC